MEEQMPLTSKESPGLIMTKHTILYLKQTSKWSLFISIIGFVFIGLSLIGSVFYWLFLFPLSEQPVSIPLFSIFYIVLALVYFFPIYYLYQFSNYLEKAFSFNTSEGLEHAFGYLKSHYKFLGVFFVSSTCFYLLFFLGISFLV
jgi:hypothetical protein